MHPLIFPCPLAVRLSLQVLSDPEKRKIYDQFGEEGLKGQMPPEASAGAHSPGMPPGGGQGAQYFRFNPRNAEDIFAEFFGGASPFGGPGMGASSRMRGMGGMGPNGMQGMGGMGGMGDSAQFQSMFGDGGGFQSFSRQPQGPVKQPAVESKLQCTLEELYTGNTRKMKISRQIADASG